LGVCETVTGGLKVLVGDPISGRQDVGKKRFNMAKSNPLEFLREVRGEANKVTWPTRKELTISTIMVMIMVVVASLFFLAVDAILKYGVDTLIFGF
jgi:preprotein translocase subunit SecE